MINCIKYRLINIFSFSDTAGRLDYFCTWLGMWIFVIGFFMIIADNKVEDEEVKTVSDIFNKLTNDKKLSKAKITKTITNLKKDDLTVDEYLKDIRPYLNAEHRELIIKAMYYVAGSDGHLDDRESELLMYTAKVLEMTPAHIKGVLSELDKSSNN